MRNFTVQHAVLKNYIQAWSTFKEVYNDPKTLDIWRNMPYKIELQ